MSTIAEYLFRAADADRAAALAGDPELRRSYLGLAASWRRAAQARGAVLTDDGFDLPSAQATQLAGGSSDRAA